MTKLASYMDRQGINDADFAAQIGRDRSMVNRLRRGIMRPTLDLAASIERVTEGAVPMRAWLDEQVAA